MRRKLNWVEVLNQQALWFNKADLFAWFAELVGRPANALDGTVEGFEEALGYMRRQVANLHFGEPVDLLWLDTQLKTVTLGLLHHQGAQEGMLSQLPHFRARVKGMHDTDLLRAVKDTLLIQFAEYVGEALDNQTRGKVSRCEGLHKTENAKTVPANVRYSAETEDRWRQELGVLIEAEAAGEDVSALHRCTNLFSGGPKARFCSDACRFSSFQIGKQVQEPGYIAEKQRPYRRRSGKSG